MAHRHDAGDHAADGHGPRAIDQRHRAAGSCRRRPAGSHAPSRCRSGSSGAASGPDTGVAPSEIVMHPEAHGARSRNRRKVETPSPRSCRKPSADDETEDRHRPRIRRDFWFSVTLLSVRPWATSSRASMSIEMRANRLAVFARRAPCALLHASAGPLRSDRPSCARQSR